MENRQSIKYVTCTMATALMFLACPDTRSSEQIADDVSAENLSQHQAYDDDSMLAYYDPR